MLHGRTELLNLLSSKQPISFSYWVTLLNFFEQYQDELDIVDMRLLVAECEELRELLNEKLHEQDKIRPEDTNPNIYTHLRMLEVKEHARLALEIEYNKESLPTNEQLVAVTQ